MPDPARPARSARVPTSGRSLAGDDQISTSAREQRVDAGSSPFDGGPCKVQTPRSGEACRKCSPRDPSRDPSIRQPRYVVSAPITTTGDGPYCYGFRTTESAAAPWATTTSQNTGLSAYSQHTPFFSPACRRRQFRRSPDAVRLLFRSPNPRELILFCHGQSSLIKTARATAGWSAIRG